MERKVARFIRIETLENGEKTFGFLVAGVHPEIKVNIEAFIKEDGGMHNSETYELNIEKIGKNNVVLRISEEDYNRYWDMEQELPEMTTPFSPWTQAVTVVKEDCPKESSLEFTSLFEEILEKRYISYEGTKQKDIPPTQEELIALRETVELLTLELLSNK